MAPAAPIGENGAENADCPQVSANEGPVDEALGSAHQLVRRTLGIHVLEALPERSHILAVDAELPVHDVLTVVLREQHLQLPSQRGRTRSGSRGGVGDRPERTQGRSRAGSEDAGNAGENSLRDPPVPHLPPLACGVVAPSLPGNVLAEVCEFAAFAQAGAEAEKAAESQDEAAGDSKFRRWTSPDDGWGTQLSSIPMQDLEKMPMSMPFTVGELADFLAHACPRPAASQEASGEPQRWAEPRSESSEKADGAAPELEVEDMLDWSLAQWRTHRLKASGEKSPSAEKDNGQSGDDQIESASRLVVEERPLIAGPVLVHRVFLAPPRPILCTDDPEASVLKVVELLLAYPELDAVPVVSPVRCTVVAHLTLSYCLAFTLGRLRGSQMGPLREMMISANAFGGQPLQRVFDGSVAAVNGLTGEDACWAESRSEGSRRQQLWVLRRSQPLRDLLKFFASTTHSGVPIVEDGPDSSCGGGLLGYLTRRDLLHFLDLAMQCARRQARRESTIPEEEQEVVDPLFEDRLVNFDVEAPVEVVLDTLKQFRQPPAASATPADEAKPPPNAWNASVLVYEEELSLKSVILQIINSGSRKLFFVEAAGDAAPRIRRLVSVGDAWRFLIGEGSVPAAAADAEIATQSEPLGGAATNDDGTQVQNLEE